jgi:hypothetical protein
VELEDAANRPGSAPKWVMAAHFRDTLLKPRERTGPLWREVERLAVEDSRVNVRQQMVRGESFTVWEWLGEGGGRDAGIANKRNFSILDRAHREGQRTVQRESVHVWVSGQGFVFTPLDSRDGRFRTLEDFVPKGFRAKNVRSGGAEWVGKVVHSVVTLKSKEGCTTV